MKSRPVRGERQGCFELVLLMQLRARSQAGAARCPLVSLEIGEGEVKGEKACPQGDDTGIEVASRHGREPCDPGSYVK